MTLSKFTFTNISFLLLSLGLALLTSIIDRTETTNPSDSLLEVFIFHGKLLIIWFAGNKILMYLNLKKSRLMFFTLSSLYLVVQSGARIETGDYLGFSHLNLIYSSFSDSMTVVLGTFSLLNIIFLVISAAIIYIDYYLHKKHNYKNKTLYIISVIVLGNLLLINGVSIYSNSARVEITKFNGSLKSLSEKELKKKPDYNVLIYIYESLSWGYSSFSKKYNNTPNFKKLALDGVEFENMNAFTPHSSKSIFSILCGTPPLLNQKILETASNLSVTCLPHLFKSQGYDPVFLQTASGGFEARPRLVDTMGYNQFYARQDLKSPKDGYLASDDAKLYSIYRKKSQSEKPFYLTLFTSSAHHPYAIPRHVGFKSEGMSDQERYIELQRHADATFGKIIENLKSRGLYDNTLIIAVSDHGEGFGINKVKQHDSNYYDEGIHIPAVIKFPKSFNIGPAVESKQYSVTEISHYLVDKLNDHIDGRMNKNMDDQFNENAFSKIKKLFGYKKKMRTVYINCWNEKRCFGWKTDSEKVILFTKSNKTKVFREARDQPPQLISERKSTNKEIKIMNDIFSQYFNISWEPEYDLLEFTNEKSGWRCKKDKGCRFFKIK